MARIDNTDEPHCAWSAEPGVLPRCKWGRPVRVFAGAAAAPVLVVNAARRAAGRSAMSHRCGPQRTASATSSSTATAGEALVGRDGVSGWRHDPFSGAALVARIGKGVVDRRVRYRTPGPVVVVDQLRLHLVL